MPLTLTMATAFLSRVFTYPPDTTISHPTTPTVSLPGYLSPITDSTWGTQVTRVSNVHLTRNEYSRKSGWNSDGSVIMMNRNGGNPVPFLDGHTYAQIKTMSRSENPCWSNTDPDIIYSATAAGLFQKVVYSTGVISTLHTFTGYSNFTIGGFEGSPSNDDRYIALQGTVGGVNKVLVYDILNDVIVGTPKTTTAIVNNCSMSQLGTYVVVQYASAGAGLQQGTWVYPRDDLSTGIQLITNTTHCDCGIDGSGNEVLVVCNDPDGNGPSYYKLSDATKKKVFVVQPWNRLNDGHVSCRNILRPGWAYFSNSTPTATPNQVFDGGNDQVVAVKLDQSAVVEVFAHSHQTMPQDTTYGWDPMATVSPDGTRVLFGSDWDAAAPANVYAYVAQAV